MNEFERRQRTFSLRLSRSHLEKARLIAASEGVSLNHFIDLAVGEKITRMVNSGEYVDSDPPSGL